MLLSRTNAFLPLTPYPDTPPNPQNASYRQPARNHVTIKEVSPKLKLPKTNKLPPRISEIITSLAQILHKHGDIRTLIQPNPNSPTLHPSFHITVTTPSHSQLKWIVISPEIEK